MQASLRDLSLARHDSQSFVICQRTLHRCHEIIFGELPPPTPSPYSTLNLPRLSHLPRMKIRSNIEPTVIGLGVVIAGTPGMPELVAIMGEVAIEQGRADDDMEAIKSLQIQNDQVAPGALVAASKDSFEGDECDLDESTSDIDASATTDNIATSSQPSIAESHRHIVVKTSSATRGSTVVAARTTPALPLHLQAARKSRQSYDPLGQFDAKSSSRPTTPFQSSPSVSSFNSPIRSSTAEVLLQKYDLLSQTQLLRSHYCRSEVRPVF